MVGSRTQSLGLLQDFPGRAPKLVWLLALLFAANSSVGTIIYLLELRQAGEPLWVIDFPSFFMAADSAFNQALSPYASTTREAYQDALGILVLPFLYPPYALPALYPFSLLDYPSGVVVALAANTVAAAALFRLLHRMFLAEIKSPAWYWPAIFVLFICSSVRETVFVGQVNLIAVLALLWAWQMLRGGSARTMLAGLLIGAAIVTKTYFALLVVLFVLRLEWRPIVGAAASVIAFTSLAAILVPSSLWVEWLADVAPSGRYGMTPFPEFPSLLSGNQSINSALIRTVGAGETAGMLCLIVSGGLLVATILLLWRRRGVPAAVYFDAALPLMLVTIYLVAPLSWMHHLLFVVPGWLRLWANAANRGSNREMLTLGIVGVWIATPWPLPYFEGISIYLTLMPIPGIAALWLLSLRNAINGRSDARAKAPLVEPLRAA